MVKQHPKKEVLTSEPSILETDYKEQSRTYDVLDYLQAHRALEGSKQSPSKLQDTIASVASEFDY
jgi:hypothetical protein